MISGLLLVLAPVGGVGAVVEGMPYQVVLTLFLTKKVQGMHC